MARCSRARSHTRSGHRLSHEGSLTLLPIPWHWLECYPCSLFTELIDGAYPLLTNVVATTNLEEACQGVAVAILLAGVVKRPQMDRQEFIAANLPIYSAAAAALQQHAEPDVKVREGGIGA